MPNLRFSGKGVVVFFLFLANLRASTITLNGTGS